MLPPDARRYLERLLEARGEGARGAWPAFKQFALTAAERMFRDGDGDLNRFATDELRFEARPRQSHGSPTVILDFTRTFSFEDGDGNYLGCYGVTLTVEFTLTHAMPPHAETTIIGRAGTGPPGANESPMPAVEWVEIVERSEGAATAPRSARRLRLNDHARRLDRMPSTAGAWVIQRVGFTIDLIPTDPAELDVDQIRREYRSLADSEAELQTIVDNYQPALGFRLGLFADLEGSERIEVRGGRIYFGPSTSGPIDLTPPEFVAAMRKSWADRGGPAGRWFRLVEALEERGVTTSGEELDEFPVRLEFSPAARKEIVDDDSEIPSTLW